MDDQIQQSPDTAIQNTTESTTAVLAPSALNRISFTVPDNWSEDRNGESIMIRPNESGGYINVVAYQTNAQGRRATYCATTDACIPETEFIPYSFAGTSGYRVQYLDNSGSGPVYIAGDSQNLYVISTYSSYEDVVPGGDQERGRRINEELDQILGSARVQ